MKKLMVMLMLLSILLVIGCSNSDEPVEGWAVLHLNSENYNGLVSITQIGDSPLQGTSSIVELPKDNSAKIGSRIVFSSCLNSPCLFKIEACGVSQFERVGCDIAQFRIIRTEEKIEFIREECSDCKKELNIIGDIEWTNNILG